jgi:hypothetical protein
VTKGRQNADAIDRVGVRLKLRRQQAEAGDIVLLYADESEALTHPYLARGANVYRERQALTLGRSVGRIPAFARTSLRVPAPGQAKKVAIMGAFDWMSRRLTITTSPTKRSSDPRLRGDKLHCAAGSP